MGKFKAHTVDYEKISQSFINKDFESNEQFEKRKEYHKGKTDPIISVFWNPKFTGHWPFDLEE